MAVTEALPHWDVTNVYPSLASPEYAAALAEWTGWLEEHERELDRAGVCAAADVSKLPDRELALVVGGVIDRTNRLVKRLETLESYVYAHHSTDTFDEGAKKKLSELEQLAVRFAAADVRFAGYVGRIGDRLESLAAHSKTVSDHLFFLRETRERSRHLMSEAEENLEQELSLAGAVAWSRLHGVVTSQILVPVELEGKVQELPMSKVRSLATEPSEEVRRRAHEAEIRAWGGARETMAACLNGVKGWGLVTNRGRKYEDAIQPSLVSARIDRRTLDALLAASAGSFPTFRRYYRAKARALGKERLAWWDKEAPVGRLEKKWAYREAADFIVCQFSGFSERLARFARRAFDSRWIDAEPRAGKVGGGFCMDLPEVAESRVLVNFDGSFDQVSTIAHELGHAYHNEMQKDVPPLRAKSPMTLAETASIFCETIVFRAALEAASSDSERLAILDANLVGASQVIVDIYSRYLFEKSVFERRAKGDLGASEFCELMRSAQLEAYGDSIDPATLHEYMWAVKPHYYIPDLSFYNYPYAFGLLFGLGLYAIYRGRGPGFVADYERMLASTGLGPAAEIARSQGIDITGEAFWRGSLGIVGEAVGRYEELAARASKDPDAGARKHDPGH
ncbi:MAG: M3 family oligoendopeptidase [Planctomycetes bacterium]|nr:M3 family oligoendopeptidase [Planctomycetota bacterium]